MSILKQLFGEKVIVELVEEKTDKNKLFVPKDMDVLFGKVLQVGDAAKRINKNEIIIFPTSSKTAFEFMGKEYFIVRENDIVGIIDDL